MQPRCWMQLETSRREPSGNRIRTYLPAEVLDAARSRLLSYCSLTNEYYKIPNHIRKMSDILERVERGELKRVIITIPPRHGKSMLCSHYFPAWYMGRNPDKYLISATYGQDLADDFGRKVRDQLSDEMFRLIFPESKLRHDSKAAARFETTKGGTYFGVGAGGPITGRGAHLLLIDDPVKNREEADSEAMRTKLWDWYRSVAYTRLMPQGAVVIIMTRWHEEDLIGQVLANENASDWTIFNLKAIGEDNKPLWPESYNLDALNDIRRTVGEYDWSCLYQQDPIPHEGIIFKPDWMKPGFAEKNEYAAFYAAVDPAISKNETSDETAICIVGLSYTNPATVHELETLHGHWTFDEQIKMIQAVHKKYNIDFFGIEDVAYQKALIQECQRLWIPVTPLKANRDKVARAMSVSHFFSQGKVRVNTQETRAQMLSFRGAGEKNDLADALIHAVGMVRDFSEMRYLKEEKAEKLTSHQWFWKMATKQEQQYENGVQEEIYDKAYSGPSNQEYF